MLDTVGITLSEVNGKYPQKLQSLNYDVVLDSDSMYKPKVISTFELAVNTILTLLFMKPGQYPSIPELGIDIESYLYEYSDDKRIPSAIRNKLIDQCGNESSHVIIGISYDKLNRLYVRKLYV